MALVCEWAGLTRRAVSWGTLVCSGVDVYICGREHCFNLEGHDTHTRLSEAIKMVNTVYDHNENICLHGLSLENSKQFCQTSTTGVFTFSSLIDSFTLSHYYYSVTPPQLD